MPRQIFGGRLFKLVDACAAAAADALCDALKNVELGHGDLLP